MLRLIRYKYCWFVLLVLSSTSFIFGVSSIMKTSSYPSQYMESKRTFTQYYDGWERDYLHLARNKFSGKNIKIALLDTRVNDKELVYKEKSFDPVASKPSDNSDLHGDGIARVIKEVAPGARVYDVEVANNQGIIKPESLIKGLKWAIGQKVDIINMSLSFQQSNPQIDELLKQAYEEGIIIVAASGNDGTGTPSYPASSPYVISVGSSGINGERLDFSNYGRQILFCSCGKYIRTGKTEQISSYHQGTSISAGLMTGMISRIKEENPDFRQSGMIERLKTMTRRDFKDEECGFGIPTF
jgi:subtilisin family serine protease